MADLLTTIALDDRQFRAGMDRASNSVTRFARGFVAFSVVRRMISSAADATRDYAHENEELSRGFHKLAAASKEFKSSWGADFNHLLNDGATQAAEVVGMLSRLRAGMTGAAADLFMGKGHSKEADDATRAAEASSRRGKLLKEVLALQTEINKETAQALKQEEQLVEIGARGRTKRITEFVNKMDPRSRLLVGDQLDRLKADAERANQAERDAFRKEKEKDARDFSERVRDDNFRRSIEVTRGKAEMERGLGRARNADMLELEARKAQLERDRERALRDIDRSTAIDPAAKAALKAETEKSFAALDAVTVLNRSAGQGGSRSLAAGFSDFASGVFGPVAAYSGLGRGDAQKTIARTGQEALRTHKETNRILREVKDAVGSAGTLR